MSTGDFKAGLFAFEGINYTFIFSPTTSGTMSLGLLTSACQMPVRRTTAFSEVRLISIKIRVTQFLRTMAPHSYRKRGSSNSP